MGDRLLPRGRLSDEGDQSWEGFALGNEKLHCEAAGLQRALAREIRIVDRNNAKAVAGSGRGICARVQEVAGAGDLSCIVAARSENNAPSQNRPADTVMKYEIGL